MSSRITNHECRRRSPLGSASQSRIKKIRRPSQSLPIALFLILNSFFYILSATPALAGPGDIKLSLPTVLYDPDRPKFDDYNLQETLASLIFVFLAAAAFIGIIYSGFMMITAGGDATKMEAGKKNLVWSIIGIIIVVLAYFIISFVYNLSGELIGAPTP